MALGGGAVLSAQGVDYAHVEPLLDCNLRRNVFGDTVAVHWVRGRDQFWYYVRTPTGPSFVYVDPVADARHALFDTARLVAAMSTAADTTFDARRPGFTDFRLRESGHVIDVEVATRLFRCDITSYMCQAQRVGNASLHSPDGKWDAFAANNNVYLRPSDGGDSIQLTADGEDLWSYAYDGNTLPRVVRRGRLGRRGPPAMQWSPDSRFLAVQRWDARGVALTPLYSSSTIRPTLYVYPVALPGDSVIDTYSIVVIDIASRTITPVQRSTTPFIHGLLMEANRPGALKWSPQSDKLYFVTGSRGSRRLTLMAADARTGQSRDVVGDTSTTTTLEISSRMEPVWQVVNGGRDVFWFSWRDGWGHIYRFDGNGRLRNRVTTGPWTVDQIVHVDERRRQVYFTARGAEPGRFLYHAYLYRANFDGTRMTLLTPEDGDHVISFAPSGRFFMDTFSRVDQPPITVLRRGKDGRVLQTLERADVSRLNAVNWTPPRPFRVTAADDVTEIYGLMYLPSGFDSTRQYPLIDHIYPIPSGSVFQWGFNLGAWQFPRALAELGFIVVEISGRGTWMRSKAFLDTYQGHVGTNTLPDHVAAIRELARRYRFVDSTRVGIYGFSGGGAASAAAILRYPELFKVAVSVAGNHDNRSVAAFWGEKFQGLLQRDSVTGTDNYEAEANYVLASNLQGKLLLVHGDLDDNAHPAATLRLVHALIAANKRFDFMLLPDRGHSGALLDPYVTRLTLDYFVTNLLDTKPPETFAFQRDSNRDLAAQVSFDWCGTAGS